MAITRIAIDPITRIEGHLRIEATIDGGAVKDAWSAGTMFRGLELILKDRDPREAWMLAQRICGVCTTVHAICSVRAVENALKLSIPDNARLLRNIIEAAQFIHDHVIHFYHLHAMDWVDVLSASKASATDASTLQKSLSPWSNNSVAYFQGVKDRLTKLVGSGQLGIFANGYWGHPAYKLPPAANLVLVAHYLEALSFQRDFIKIHALLGGKSPHPATYAIGGMAIPLDKTDSNAITPAKIGAMKTLAQQALMFVTQVYLPDVKAVARYYPQWTTVGRGPANFLAVGDFPQNNTDFVGSLYLPRGVVINGNLAAAPAALDDKRILEFIDRSWYQYAGGDSVGLHPSIGETTPNFTGPTPPYNWLDTNDKYSWLKAPRYDGMVMEVGPLARMAIAYAARHSRIKPLVDSMLAELKLPATALLSTLGRIAARALETQVLAESLIAWLDSLAANINAGNLTVANNSKWQPSSWPATAAGWGATEAPRGALGHWVRFAAGKIQHYQAVVPTTWNASPRDAAAKRGAIEEAIVGTPVADATRPLEILRTVHSFDPCMACAVHVLDTTGQELVQVRNSIFHF